MNPGQFFIYFFAERLACCRAAVRWLCELDVRRHGQQAVVPCLGYFIY